MFLSSNEYLLITNGYSAKCLLAFLNSKASEWLLGNITGNLGGNAKIGQKSNFLKLSVAQLNSTQQKKFDLTVDEVLQAKKMQRDSNALEHSIDKMIYELYHLPDEEVEYIESNV